MLMFALLGLHLFGGRYDAAMSAGIIAEVPLYHFNDLWMSIVTVFQVRALLLRFERWASDSAIAHPHQHAQLVVTEDFKETVAIHMAAFGPVTILYFVSAIVLGHCMFLAIFLAVFVHELEHRLHRELASTLPALHQVGGTLSRALDQTCCMVTLEAMITTRTMRLATPTLALPVLATTGIKPGTPAAATPAALRPAADALAAAALMSAATVAGTLVLASRLTLAQLYLSLSPRCSTSSMLVTSATL